jgi:hypothetical protein
VIDASALDVLGGLVRLVAVEQAIPADHPASLLAVPLGLLFFSGSIYLLLWSNYGARKAGAIYGTAFFGFSFLIGIFWWLGGPGIPPNLGITHLPGQTNDHYQDRWYGFEPGSERDEFFPVTEDAGAFQSIEAFLGLEGQDEEDILENPRYASLSGSVGQAEELMREQFLPIDENNVAQIGRDRRAGYEEDVQAAQPEEAAGRATPFFTAESVGDPMIAEDPEAGTEVLMVEFQAFATFVDDEEIPLDPIPVGEPQAWFAFYDPGASWFPSSLWTIISIIGFALSLFWLDAIEAREKRLLAQEVEQPEDLAVPIAQ